MSIFTVLSSLLSGFNPRVVERENVLNILLVKTRHVYKSKSQMLIPGAFDYSTITCCCHSSFLLSFYFPPVVYLFAAPFYFGDSENSAEEKKKAEVVNVHRGNACESIRAAPSRKGERIFNVILMLFLITIHRNNSICLFN